MPCTCRRFSVALAALALLGLAFGGNVARGADSPDVVEPKLPISQGRAVEIRGEVVETSCYLREGKRGESHRACALRCLASGGQLAIVEDETATLYPLAGNTPASDPSAAARTHVAGHVLVSGRLFERAGGRVLVLEQIERLD